jgi:F-type H+-transporting ATPase subunit alpha
MIERACYLDEKHGGGSITFFPIVEILEGDLTAFVPSNLIAMTDGQIYLNASLFGEGQKPALDLGLSVSRVGSKVQWPAIKNLSGPLRLEYLQFRELLRISKLKVSGHSDETMDKLKRGAILTEILRQEKDKPVSQEIQVLVLYAFNKKMMNEFTVEEVRVFQDGILEYARQKNPDLLQLIRDKRKLEPDIEKGIVDLLTVFIQGILARRKKDVPDKFDDYVDTSDKAQSLTAGKK